MVTGITRRMLGLWWLCTGVCFAQAPLASSTGQWLLNPGAERSLVVSSGELLGAGQFRVNLATHALYAPGSAAPAWQLREHVTVAWAPHGRIQLQAQVPVVLLQRPAPAPELGVGRPWAGLKVGLLSPDWDDAVWLALEGAVGIPGLEQAELATRTTLPSGVFKVSAGVPSSRGVLGLEASGRAGVGQVEVGGGVTFASQGVHLGGELTVRGEAAVWGALRGFIELLGGVRYRLRPVELSLLGGPGYGTTGFGGRLVFGLAFVNGEEDPTDATRERPADCTEGTAYRLEACPDGDWDHDGLTNGVDHCPREFGPKENDGCPWPDRDDDSVIDPIDNCPTVPGPPENAGCPPGRPQKVLIRAERLEILERVFFEFNKAEIKPESFELLQQVAEVLRAHPELDHVRIEGHTDRVGSADYNRELSAARARAVKSFLVERGEIEGTRLTTRGFGFDRPIASNEDEAGRAENRRVEFVILRQAESDD